MEPTQSVTPGSRVKEVSQPERMSEDELRMLYHTVRSWPEVVDVDDTDPYNPIIQFGVVGEVDYTSRLYLVPPHKVQLKLYARNENRDGHWDSRARVLDSDIGSHPKFWRSLPMYGTYQDGSACFGNVSMSYDNPVRALAQLRQFYIAAMWGNGDQILGLVHHNDKWWKDNAKAWFKKYPKQTITIVDGKEAYNPKVRMFKPNAKFIKSYNPGCVWTEEMERALIK